MLLSEWLCPQMMPSVLWAGVSSPTSPRRAQPSMFMCLKYCLEAAQCYFLCFLMRSSIFPMCFFNNCTVSCLRRLWMVSWLAEISLEQILTQELPRRLWERNHVPGLFSAHESVELSIRKNKESLIWAIGRASVEVSVWVFPGLLLAHMEYVCTNQKEKMSLAGVAVPRPRGWGLMRGEFLSSLAPEPTCPCAVNGLLSFILLPWVYHPLFLCRTPDILKTTTKQGEFC